MVEIAVAFIGLLAVLIPQNRTLNRLVKHDREQYLAIQRLIIVNKDMPLSERLIAGRDYIKNGGNGDVKKFYEKLRRECDNEQGID